MNPPSLREICAKAMESRPTLAGYLSTWTPTRTFTKDESALAARFSPATALAVYEALEKLTEIHGNATPGTYEDQLRQIGQRALAKLNGESL